MDIDAPAKKHGRGHFLVGRSCLQINRVAIAEKPAGRFMIRSRTRAVKRHPEGDW
jgi:hypothetical protein